MSDARRGRLPLRERERSAGAAWGRAASRWLVLACAVGFAGCLQGPMEEPEHVVPAHRPADYPAAVARMDALLREAESADSRAAESIDCVTEWTDLVRWLPDMAGDSDLKESSWNRVNESARTMEQLARAWEHLDGEARREAFRKSVKTLRAPWETLDQIARDERAVFRSAHPALPADDTGAKP